MLIVSKFFVPVPKIFRLLSKIFLVLISCTETQKEIILHNLIELKQYFHQVERRLLHDCHNLSVAWRSGSERRFYDDHDRKVNGSTPNLVSLLRPWIRCFTMIISAWWNLASSKLKKSQENSSGKLGNKGNS